jgi:hypothetical protein
LFQLVLGNGTVDGGNLESDQRKLIVPVGAPLKRIGRKFLAVHSAETGDPKEHNQADATGYEQTEENSHQNPPEHRKSLR